MFTVYKKDESLIFTTGFKTYEEAQYYGNIIFGPNNFEIEREW